jgi:hypothetical protein
MTEADTIAQGVAAWSRIRASGRRSWSDWVLVSCALAEGRAKAMAKAQSNVPMGTRYNKLFGEWLAETGLSGIDGQQRYRALVCLENLPAIEQWRATLSEKERERLNHPGAVWTHWRRAAKPASAPKRRRRAAKPKREQITERIAEVALARRRGKAIFWGQDHLRRAHRAMLDSRSTDLLTLARLALQGAIRNEADLLALLGEEPQSEGRGNGAAAQAAA